MFKKHAIVLIRNSETQCLFAFVVLKSFQPIRAIAGLWDAGKGAAVALGEIDSPWGKAKTLARRLRTSA